LSVYLTCCDCFGVNCHNETMSLKVALVEGYFTKIEMYLKAHCDSFAKRKPSRSHLPLQIKMASQLLHKNATQISIQIEGNLYSTETTMRQDC